MDVQTYLFYDGVCREAIDVYVQALSAEVLYLQRFADAPIELRARGREDMVFHATLRIGQTILSLCDDPTRERGAFGGFALLVHFDSSRAVDSAARLLADGGAVELEPQSTFWAEWYAIVRDRFGITWKLQHSTS